MQNAVYLFQNNSPVMFKWKNAATSYSEMFPLWKIVGVAHVTADVMLENEANFYAFPSLSVLLCSLQCNT